MEAAENKRCRCGGKAGIDVRKDMLNHDAIMAIENIHRLLIFHRQD